MASSIASGSPPVKRVAVMAPNEVDPAVALVPGLLKRDSHFEAHEGGHIRVSLTVAKSFLHITSTSEAHMRGGAVGRV